MKKKARWLVVGILLGGMFFLSGCFFNIFQTAETIGKGNVALTLGTGAMQITVGDNTNLLFVPQARVTIGLADNVDLGVTTGAMMSLNGGNPGWLGAEGDLKFGLFDEPDAFALAIGFGGGYTFIQGGWGAFGEVLFNSNLRVLPIFVAYRPIVPFGADELTILHQLAGGLRLRVSPQASLFLQADNLNGLISFGIGLEIVF